MSRSIFDERMVPALINGFFTSRCTIEQHDGTLDTQGQTSVDGWTAFAGHVNIPCSIRPAGQAGRATERRTATGTFTNATNVATLAGSFPSITSVMRADIDGQKFNIFPPEFPSQGNITSLTLELVTT